MKKPQIKQAITLITACIVGSAYSVQDPSKHICPPESPETSSELQETMVLSVPSGLPDSFSVAIDFQGRPWILHLEKYSVFGAHTKFLVADGSGALKEVPTGPVRSYQGYVEGQPGVAVSAVLSDAGLVAHIIRPSEPTIMVEPVLDRPGAMVHTITMRTQLEQAGTPLVTAQTTSAAMPSPTSADVLSLETTATPEIASTPTTPPNRVMDVLEYEVGVEIGSPAFLNNYGGDLAYAQSVAQGLPGNLNSRYVRAAGIRFRLGTVIIRTTAGSDPFSVANGNDSAGLSAFRDYWNSHPGEVGTTHDLAVYHVKASPSGLAYVNSVGSANRYALSASNGATSWADGTITHEFGHSWNLHHTSGQEEVYESKPRNFSGSHSAGGSDVFVSIMNGSGSHNIGRLASYEAERVYNARQNKRAYGDLVANPGPIAPFGFEDNISIFSLNPITIDPVVNDYDCNNDPLNVQILDTVSQQGGSISLSVGTGPGGRDELTYTPPAAFSGGIDFFHYTVVDTTGRTDWGCVYIKLDGIITVDLNATSFNYDLGTGSSPVMAGWTLLPAEVSGDVSWTGDAIAAIDRGAQTGVNDINRDLIYGSGTSQLNHKIGNGVWAITINMGDTDYAHDQMGVRAEGIELHNNINNAAGEFPYANGQVTVTDGTLNLEFFDNGGADPNWVVTRLSLTKLGDLVSIDTNTDTFNYDLGPAGSPVMSGWTQLTPDVAGDVHWTGGWIKGYDRDPGGGVNDINRDLILGTGTSTLNHKLGNGIWNITLNMGDASSARDQMIVKAEGIVIEAGLDAAANTYPYAYGNNIAVTDGELNLEFSDGGGANSSWVATRLSLTKVADSTTVTVDLTATAYQYDLGPMSSPVLAGWTAIYPETDGDISWTGGPVDGVDRPTGSSNASIRDYIRGTANATLNHAVSNGVWDIIITMGDTDLAHDDMGVRAEGALIESGVDSSASVFMPQINGQAIVTDGELNLEFFDAGGSDPNWVVNRLTLTYNSSLADDYDNDGLPNEWEQLYFTNSIAGDPLGDPDLDGLKNLAEYAFGGDPLVPGALGVPRLEFSSGTPTCVSLLRDDPGLQATIFVRTNLTSGAWTPHAVITGVSGDGYSAHTNSLPSEPSLFMKWQVEK